MRMPPGREQVHIAQAALETRKPDLISEVTPDLVRSWAASEEHLVALESIGPTSAMIAPLLVHGRLLGALSLISSDKSRRYGRADLRIAVALAGRSAFFLENARLYREAKRATQAREDMLQIVAHDLRNPLAAILASAAVLSRKGQEREVADEIAHAANRMGSLIEDLIDVTRLQTGKLPFRPARLDASEIVSDIQEAQGQLAASSSLELRLDIATGLPDIWADRDRLLQVFENLISNAIKFTKSGGQITLGAVAREGEVVFSVADTGCGMASHQVPHMFDLFWQAPEAANRGAGLGLPIVKGIVEGHGGRVWVESKPGHGSTFFFAIPTASRAAAQR
jgi:signal transduction histidine kinase